MDSPQCPICNQPLDPSVAGGLCVRCLVVLGTGTPPEPPPGLFTGRIALPPGQTYRFGDYELLRELGRGGMGVVYRARQISLNREVALKLILPGPFASEDFLRRFQTEAEIIGRLPHPNIVAIYEIGDRGGQPYFSMQYVPGKTLADLKGDFSLPPSAVAGLMVTVARAVQYMHDRAVLHRDLKPTNVLLDEKGQPRITDFGLAKRLDKMDEFTLTGQILGTPAYASPEQISAKSRDLTVRSDVYSLGAILYFLLTGLPPIVADSLAATFKAVSETEPPPLRQIKSSIPRELETICLKCLAKEPGGRYETAEALARDIERWLAGKPINAKPVGLLGQQWLWIKRNPVVSTLCAILLLSILAGTVGIVREWRLSERNRIHADNSRGQMLATTIRVQAQKAEELFDQHKPHEALAMLAANVRLDPGNWAVVSRLRSALTYRSFVHPVMPPLDDGSSLLAAQMSSDGSRIVTQGVGDRMRLWDAASGRPIGPSVELPGTLIEVAISENSQTFITVVPSDAVCFWDARTGGQLGRFPCAGTSGAASISKDGFCAILGMTNGDITIFDRRKPGGEKRWKAHTGLVNSVGFYANGRIFVSGSDDHSAKLWDVRNDFKLMLAIDHSNDVNSASVSPDGKRLVTFSARTNLSRLWEVPSGRLVATLNDSAPAVFEGVFSPDSTRIVVGDDQGVAFLYDAATGRQILRYGGHSKKILTFDFSPDGQQVATCGFDNTAQIWDIHSGMPLSELIPHENMATVVQFDSTGRRLLTCGMTGGVHLWDIFPRAAPPLRASPGEPLIAMALSPDDGGLWTISKAGAVRVWDPRTCAVVRTVCEGGSTPLERAQFNRAVTLAVSLRAGNLLSILNLTNGAVTSIPGLANEFLRYAFDFSPDGGRLAFAAQNDLFIYDVRTGQLLLGPLRCTSPVERFSHCVTGLRYSPDGGKIAMSCDALHARVWNASNGAVLGDFPHQALVTSVDFSPDGGCLLTSSADDTARIWALTNSTAPLQVLRHHDWVRAAIFSKDGQKVLTGTFGTRAYLWDTKTGGNIPLTMPPSQWTYPGAFSPSGSEALILTFGPEGIFRRWDAQSGLPVSEPYFIGASTLVAPSFHWDFFAACPGLDTVQIWRETAPAIPSPEWLPALAEGVAGLRYSTNGVEQSVPAGELLALREKLARGVNTDPWNQWAKWFFGGIPERTSSWDSPVTMQTCVDSLLAADRLEDLRQALLYAPTNGLVLARLARRTLDETNNPCRLGEADFLSRRALEFAPNSPEVIKLRAGVSSHLDTR